MARRNIFLITATDNSGIRRTIGRFRTKREAEQMLRELLAPAKKRIITVGGKRKVISLTSFRGGISGTGINNPRMKIITTNSI